MDKPGNNVAATERSGPSPAQPMAWPNRKAAMLCVDLERKSCGVTTRAPVLCEAIARLSHKHPRITFNVSVSDTSTLVGALRERSLDVVVTRWDNSSSYEDLAVEPLFDAPLAVLADARRPLPRRRRLTLADLTDAAWTLSPPDSYLGQVVPNLFIGRKLAQPAAVMTTISVHMRLNLAPPRPHAGCAASRPADRAGEPHPVAAPALAAPIRGSACATRCG
jgi:DNA-binding transcriptional LysR family regulator